MSDPGKIQGPKLLTLFEALINDKNIISMHVVGTDFQRLTCISAIEHTRDGDYLVVDRPDGFAQAIDNEESIKIRFNFNGADQLEYIFGTSGGTSRGKDLKIPFPDHVERLQRRKNFRIDTFPGTKLLFSSGKLKGQIDLINISIGGAFGALNRHNQKDLKGSLFKVDQRLYKTRIVFPGDKIMDEQTIVIKKVEVRRIERDRERKRYRYAFEFMAVETEQAHILKEAIYHIQRQYLQNR